MSDYIPEGLIKDQPCPVSIKGTKQILFQMENCVCQIKKKNGIIGTGFFSKVPLPNNGKEMPVLITNNHILNEKDIDNNQIIDLMINNKVKTIKIDDSRKKYTEKNLDITIIEIRPLIDGIEYYLDIDKEDLDKDEKNLELEYLKKSIYIIHYPEDEIEVSYGMINDLEDNKIINHYCNTKEGSSGGPILSLKSFKVIGVHFGRSKIFIFNIGIFIKKIIDEFNKNNKNNINRNKISLIYISKKEGEENIFGEKFVENNKNKIELIINGKKSKLINKCKMEKGENIIIMEIKKKITNVEEIFVSCNTLKNINELEYIDTKDIKDFSCMFYGCSSLSDIKSLENWDVSNSKDFNGMFYGCSNLSDIEPLENWNVSNSKDFSCMFKGCSSLSDIKSLENWNVSNSSSFACMFDGCSSLSDIEALENWNVSNSKDFNGMFYGCSNLSDIQALENWNVSNSNDFGCMFCGCSNLLNINSLKNWNLSKSNDFNGMFCGCLNLLNINSLDNWNVSNSKKFTCMFKGCSSLSDIKSLENWDVSNSTNFSGMFDGCSSLSDIKSLKNWNVSNSNDFSGMFYECSSLSDIEALENWDVSNSNNFSRMFYGCSSLSDIEPLQNWNLPNSIYDSMFIMFNPSINYNNLFIKKKNINYNKNNQNKIKYQKRKKPFIYFRNTLNNLNRINTDLNLSSLNKKESKKIIKVNRAKNSASPFLGNRMNNNKFFGLCRKNSSRSISDSINNNIISNNNSCEKNYSLEKMNIKENHNYLNYKKKLQSKEKNSLDKSLIKNKNIYKEYMGNSIKIHKIFNINNKPEKITSYNEK